MVHKFTRTDLRKLIKEEVSTADKDFAAANNMAPEIADAVQSLEDLFKAVDKNLSSFNSPGLKAAIAGGLKAGLSRDGFNATRAHKVIEKYFTR